MENIALALFLMPILWFAGIAIGAIAEVLSKVARWL
jgi:hypothetical protein